MQATEAKASYAAATAKEYTAARLVPSVLREGNTMAKQKQKRKRKSNPPPMLDPAMYNPKIVESGPGVYRNVRIYRDGDGCWMVAARHYADDRVEFDLCADPGESLASLRTRAAEFSGQRPSEIRVLKYPPRYSKQKYRRTVRRVIS